jgi:hypothetical protein
MAHPKKIVLHWRSGHTSQIEMLVEEFIRDEVIFVGVVGKDCALVEEIIDEIVVGNGDRNYHLLTSSHASVEEAIRFANALTGEFEGKTQVIEF